MKRPATILLQSFAIAIGLLALPLVAQEKAKTGSERRNRLSQSLLRQTRKP